jgi:hypothetical protein
MDTMDLVLNTFPNPLSRQPLPSRPHRFNDCERIIAHYNRKKLVS